MGSIVNFGPETIHKQPLCPVVTDKRGLGTHMISDPKMPNSQIVRQKCSWLSAAGTEPTECNFSRASLPH